MSITVVIPAYNSARFIAETIKSALNQTLPPDEVLVIDDGSTDATGDIAKSFGPPVRVIRTPNRKVSAARNRGTLEATSEWIALLDADDLWEPNKLERQMQELDRHPGADLCYSGRVVLVQDDDTTHLGDIVAVPPAEEISEALLEQSRFPPSAVIIRRSTLLAVGGFDIDFTHAEDWELWLRLRNRGAKFVCCPEPLLQYRVHPASISHQALPQLEATDRVFRLRAMPQLPRHKRWNRYRRFRGAQESIAALILREKGDPRHLSLMAVSILRRPSFWPSRYKIMAHMLYTRLKKSLSRTPLQT